MIVLVIFEWLFLTPNLYNSRLSRYHLSMKSIIIILANMIVAVPQIVFACSCNFEYLNKVINDPAHASSAFIALYKDHHFEVSKNWKPVPSSKIKVESSWPGHVTKCDINLISGQEYLVISTEKTKEPYSLSICSSKVVKKGEAQEIISKLEKSAKK